MAIVEFYQNSAKFFLLFVWKQMKLLHGRWINTSALDRSKHEGVNEQMRMRT